MQGMNFRGVFTFLIGLIVIIVAIAGYIGYRKGHKYSMELKTKKPIIPTLIIEKKGSKSDTTYIYQFEH